MKTCKCGVTGEENFYKDKSMPDGLAFYCKSCVSKYNEKYRKSENGRKVMNDCIKRWLEANPGKFKESQKKYWENNKDKKKEIQKRANIRNRKVKTLLLKNKDRIFGIDPELDEIINFWMDNLYLSKYKNQI